MAAEIAELRGVDTPSGKMLFKAVVNNDIETLQLALSQPDVDVNTQNANGETPLLLSVLKENSSDFIMRLIRTGCDVNIPDLERSTPLHHAISWPSTDIGRELIESGAKINAQEKPIQRHQNCTRKGCVWAKEKTPLHHAVLDDNLEAACMLLYYGADVHITDKTSKPINYAIRYGFDDIVKVLIDYYDDFHYLEKMRQDKFFYEIFVFECEGSDLLIECFDCAPMFKLMWSKMNPYNFSPCELHSLLLTYINRSDFSTLDWLQCLYLMLDVFVALELGNVHVLHKCEEDRSDFADLFDAFCRKNVERTDRVAVINVFLSLGAPVTTNDCEYAHQLFGFAGEVEALVYGMSHRDSVKKQLCTTSNFILAIEEDFSAESVFRLLKLHFGKSRLYSRRPPVHAPPDYFVALFGFFSLSSEQKRELLGFFRRHSQDAQKKVSDKLELIPEFPTLFELGRNQARKYIKEACKVKYPYQFYDFVTKLNFPEVIKDVIRFKRAIY